MTDHDVPPVRFGFTSTGVGSACPVLLYAPGGIGYPYSDEFLRSILVPGFPLERIPLSRAWFQASVSVHATFSDPTPPKHPVRVGKDYVGKTLSARYIPLRSLYVLAAVVRWELRGGGSAEDLALLEDAGAEAVSGVLRGGFGFLRSAVRFLVTDHEPEREVFLGNMDGIVAALTPLGGGFSFPASSVGWWHGLVASAVALSYPQLDGPGLRTVTRPDGEEVPAGGVPVGTLPFPDAPVPPPVTQAPGGSAQSDTTHGPVLGGFGSALTGLGKIASEATASFKLSGLSGGEGVVVKAFEQEWEGEIAHVADKTAVLAGIYGSPALPGQLKETAWSCAVGDVVTHVKSSPDGPGFFRVEVAGAKEWSAKGVADAIAAVLGKPDEVPPGTPVPSGSGYSSLNAYVHCSPYCEVKAEEDAVGDFQVTITGLPSSAKWGTKSLAIAIHGFLSVDSAVDETVADLVMFGSKIDTGKLPVTIPVEYKVPPLQQVPKKSLPLVDLPTPLEREVARVHAGSPVGPSKDQVAAILKALPAVLGESLKRVGFVSGVSDTKMVADVLAAFLPTEDVIPLPDTSWLE